jgi:uncharacterized membrane protein YesL
VIAGWLLLTLAGGVVLSALLAVLAVILVARRLAFESLDRE